MTNVPECGVSSFIFEVEVDDDGGLFINQVLVGNTMNSLMSHKHEDSARLKDMWHLNQGKKESILFKILLDNKISTVAANAFDNFVSLEYLDLGANTISSLPGGLFSKNINLTTIDLGTNTISSLPGGLFSKNINLRIISLSQNQLLCCNMTDLFEWAAIQTKATLYGDCTDFGIVTNIQEFNISNCTIPGMLDNQGKITIEEWSGFTDELIKMHHYLH
ncbi:Hypothetical predicted protein [Mytilus galloprovincialis]|uniref:LRRCT domain-containing protein n=1 Tax=Mytilus galloprovincialis TaxID=29158 RepID=A0A8B6CIY3_MYTGA|nr:Hypothetical predicted protein [Mytilus galloprovincialis]